MTSMLTSACLKTYLHYCPETGLFTWLRKISQNAKGSVAGTTTYQGYVAIAIAGKKYLAHRLAWLYMTGEMPSDLLDHINGIKNDNRIANLRPANKILNGQNMPRLKSNNTSGYTGVVKCSRSSKWIAQINVNRQCKVIGRYATAEEASEAYLSYKKIHHEYFVA
jgi:hypothetical protein